MSNDDNIQQVVAGGIQDISAILPLLGTEQCEEHVGSALSRGYLYVVATPISIFGSLGIVKAGFNILLSSITFQRGLFLGAIRLAYGGFKPKGNTASMIAMDDANPDCFLAESELLKMLQDENIENLEDLTVEWNEDTIKWNLHMIALSFVSALGFTPYIFSVVSHSANSLLFHGWPFPIMRLLGCTISAIVAQFIIQIRILKIVKSRLIFILVDRYVQVHSDPQLSERYQEVFKEDIWSENISSEICLWNLGKQLSGHRKRGARDEDIEFNSMYLQDVHDYLKKQYKRHFPCNTMQERLCGHGMLSKILLFSLQLFLFFAMVFSIIGYIGSFYVIQNAQSGSIGPLLWIGLEVLLSLIRIIIWAFNPRWDDAKGMVFKLNLVNKLPLPTCNLYGNEFEKLGSAQFVRAKEFLNETAAFSGPTPSFIWDDASLYFMITRSDPQHNSRALYLVVVHNKEQTSRLLVKRGQKSSFSIYHCSMKFHPRKPIIEVETNFKSDGEDTETHLFTSNHDFMKSLSDYYDEIIHRYTDMKEVILFRKPWNLNAVKNAESIRTNYAVNRAESQLQQRPIPAQTLPLSVDSHIIYLQTAFMKRQGLHLIDQLMNWLKQYINHFVCQDIIDDGEYVEGISLKTIASHMMIFEMEVVTKLRQIFRTWKISIQTQHDIMLATISEGNNTVSMDKLKKRMIKRLLDERELFIRQYERIADESIVTLRELTKAIRNMAYEQTARTGHNSERLIRRVKCNSLREELFLLSFENNPEIKSILKLEGKILKDRVICHLEEISKLNEENILSPNSALAKYWRQDAVKQKLRFLDRRNKFLEISDEAYDAFGSLDGLISALYAAGTITLLAFTSSIFTTESIIKIITEVPSITSVAVSWYIPHIDIKIKDALEKNRERVSYLKYMMYYENISTEKLLYEDESDPVGSNSKQLDRLILVFRIGDINISGYTGGWKSVEDDKGINSLGYGNNMEASIAVVKFEIKDKVNHTLSLEHRIWRGSKKYFQVEIILNDERFLVKVMYTRAFYVQDIVLPHTILNDPGQYNTLQLTPRGIVSGDSRYHLLDMCIRPEKAESSDRSLAQLETIENLQ